MFPIICAFILLVFVLILRWKDNFPTTVIAVIAGLCLFFSLVIFPAEYYRNTNKTVGFIMAKETIEKMRESSDQIERAAVILSIVEWNAWLARAKHWDDSFLFDWCYPDSVRLLQPIE